MAYAIAPDRHHWPQTRRPYTDIRETLEKLYQDYQNRDLQAVLNSIHDDFCFEWPVDPKTSRYSGACQSRLDFVTQLTELASDFDFNRYSASYIIVQGNQAAAEIEIDVTSKNTGDRFSSRLAHFWTFEHGRPVKLVEYIDTAQLAQHCA